jgi:hypothetical protein
MKKKQNDFVKGLTLPITHRLLGINSINGFSAHNSSPRAVMFMSHISQHLTLNEGEPPLILSGLETELAKSTFSTRVPTNSTVLTTIERFPTVGMNSYAFNPESMLIIENEARQLDCIQLSYYKSLHQHFGFKNKFNEEAMSKIYPNSSIPAGTVLADPPSVTKDGYYTYGKNLNTVLVSSPDVGEDAIIISESAAKSMTFNVYERRTIGTGRDNIPVNLFGTPNNYKGFPDIGDEIREDGLLMLLRSTEENMAVSTQSIHDLQEPGSIFDKRHYTRPGKGRVIMVEVIRSENEGNNIPAAIRAQLDKYWLTTKTYYERIINFYEEYRRVYRNKYNTDVVKMSDAFNELLRRAYFVTGQATKFDRERSSVELQYRKDPLDEYTITFTVEYTMEAREGVKISGRAGDKGVITKVQPDELMPFDKNGVRADVMVCAGSTVSRMNLGRLYEHYFGAVSRETKTKLKNIFGIGDKVPSFREFVNGSHPDQFNLAFNYLEGLLAIVCPELHKKFMEYSFSHKCKYVHECIEDECRFIMRVEGNPSPHDIANTLENSPYKPFRDSVYLRDENGNLLETKEPIRIAPMHFMVHDKIGDAWSSVSTAKLQHFGLLSPISKSEKTQYNFRFNPVRTMGETELRIIASYAGPEALAEIVDRNNSIFTQKMAAWNIISNPTPTNIDNIVDRDIVDYDSSRPLELFKHAFLCMGIRIVYRNDDDTKTFSENDN